MRADNSATHPSSIAVAEPAGPLRTTPAIRPEAAEAATAGRGPGSGPARQPSAGRSGTVLAGLGVVAFSLTFPATVWGLESFGPWSLVALRSVLAALIAGGGLLSAS
ncbi:EamA family transporter, partial [Streptomyces griseus]|nr:EamA family transporter [Streptomyces griseus]